MQPAMAREKPPMRREEQGEGDPWHIVTCIQCDNQILQVCKGGRRQFGGGGGLNIFKQINSINQLKHLWKEGTRISASSLRPNTKIFNINYLIFSH